MPITPHLRACSYAQNSEAKFGILKGAMEELPSMTIVKDVLYNETRLKPDLFVFKSN